LKGFKGLKGPKGIKAAKGLKGIKGEIGFKAIKGSKGHKGIKGLEGEKGIKGIKAETGPGGVEGVKGLAGGPGFPVAAAALEEEINKDEQPLMRMQKLAKTFTGSLAMACMVLGLVLFSLIVLYVRERGRYGRYKKLLESSAGASLGRRNSGPVV